MDEARDVGSRSETELHMTIANAINVGIEAIERLQELTSEPDDEQRLNYAAQVLELLRRGYYAGVE